jgi:hypothetical protein
MRLVRQPGAPETRYAMPLSHSQKLLWVSFKPLSMTVTRLGFAGSDTSHNSWELVPRVRSKYTLFLLARGSSLPSHTRVICAPPDSPGPGMRGSPGMCARYFGFLGSVTSTMDVPLSSIWPLSVFSAVPPWWPM